MAGVVVVGAQWGDEGKGKIVDWLSSRADVVVRFQGGHNAGHTLVIDGKTFKLNLLPSGVVRGGKLSVIGNGVVVDPWQLLSELDGMAKEGVTLGPDDLVLADNACLILPWHKDIDAARESALGDSKIGTTKRGIGPAYEDRVGRRAIRVADLADPAALDLKIERLLAHHRPLRAGVGLPEPDAEALKADFGAIPSHVKHLARLTGTNERTVHNWLLARNGPSGTALVMLMRHSDAVTEAVLALAGRDEHSAAVRLVKVKNILRARALELVECLGPA